MLTDRFHPDNRDVDETISWIKEKEQLMASDDFGRDLASVQALLRKHEGLERDLAALEDKVRAALHKVYTTQQPQLKKPDVVISLPARSTRSTLWAGTQSACRRHTHRTPPRST